MTPVLAAFPQRPLTLKPGRGALGGWMTTLAGLLLFGAFLAMLAIEIGPALRTDLQIRDQAVPAPQVRVTDGRCRSRLFLFQSCEVTLSWRGKDGTGTRKVSYMFVEPHMGSWSVQAMMDPSRPDLVSTDLGLDRLWNRIATLVGGAIFALVLIFGLFLVARKAQAKKREVKALSGRALRAVPVRFAGWGDGPSWRVQDEHGATFEWPVRKSDKPFVLDEARGLVLALRDPAGGPAFPLDEKLRFVQLTAEERARIEAARWRPG
ncbi:hypothetical protein GXW74_14400 [Roseomonas eburnea]|uniref:Uncharacterized protein n=1 Tax=Neoroseomonas eburnea TaxID=1346889 RepID=A0A9X9XD97_9PROT|nr:hypothetical protein [Neoroseomonas eburnea]MBR0681683.1 hypothetical protein [Neoroseomonas eburnea]